METDKKLSKQEQNWLMMSMLQIPWSEANKIEDPLDRDFLVGKANEMREELIRQRDAHTAQSSLITPSL